MKDRTSIAPWPTLPDQRPPLTGTSHTISADRIDEGPAAVELCEAWRAWEAGTSSEFLNWLLFKPPGTSSPAETAVLEDWICFNAGRSELDEGARTILGSRLELYRANPAMRIIIGGLACQPGTIDYVMSLGLIRVQSIRTFLLAHGIDRGRIGIAVRGSGWSVIERSRGSGDPTNQDSECRLQVTDPLWTVTRN